MTPFSFIGGQGGGSSTQFSPETLINCRYFTSEASGETGVFEMPGQESWYSGNGLDRGATVMDGVVYSIQGGNLYSVSSLGVGTLLGAVSGADRAVFANDGANLLFTTDGKLWIYNGSTLTAIDLSHISQLGTPSTIAFFNQIFIVTDANGIFATSTAGSATTWSALDYAEAEVIPDGLVRCYIFSSKAYMFGGESIEVNYYAGTGNPPVVRQDTSLINIGLVGKYAVTNSDKYLYWIGNDKKLYQAVGASARVVSGDAIASSLSEAVDSQTILTVVTIDGSDYVIMAFPASNKCYYFSEKYQNFGRLISDTDVNGDRWYGNSVINAYGYQLSIDHRNGNIYKISDTTYTDNGEQRVRAVSTKAFTGKSIGHVGQITVSHIRISMQTGVGLDSGQGSNPLLMAEMSSDGGHTWGPESQISIGAEGDYLRAVDYYDFSTGYEVVLRVKHTDPVPLALFGGKVDIKAAGW